MLIWKNDTLEIEGANVRELLEHLQDEYPESKAALFDEEGSLRPFVSIYVNDTRVSPVSEDPVGERDTVLLLPSIAGGVPAESLPRSMREEGHKILDLIKNADGTYDLIVKKVGE